MKFFCKNEKNQKRNYIFENVLSLLLPYKLVPHVKNNSFYSKREENIAIVFIDLCDFDDIVENKGVEILNLLEIIWRFYDDLTVFYGGQKIETVGKTYMAAFGLSWSDSKCIFLKNNPDHLHRALLFANQVNKRSSEIVWNNSKSIQTKIGIHKGDILTGIIGNHKPQFSLIGDAVNTTSRMCFLAKCGEIILSDIFYQTLNQKTLITDSKIVPVKGKGDMMIHKLMSLDVLSSIHELKGLQAVNPLSDKTLKKFRRREIDLSDVEAMRIDSGLISKTDIKNTRTRERVEKKLLPSREQLELSFSQCSICIEDLVFHEKIFLIFRNSKQEREFFIWFKEKYLKVDFILIGALSAIMILHFISIWVMNDRINYREVLLPLHLFNFISVLAILISILKFKGNFWIFQMGFLFSLTIFYGIFLTLFHAENFNVEIAFVLIKTEIVLFLRSFFII